MEFHSPETALLIALKDLQSLLSREDVAQVLVRPGVHLDTAAIQAVIRDLQLLVDFYP